MFKVDKIKESFLNDIEYLRDVVDYCNIDYDEILKHSIDYILGEVMKGDYKYQLELYRIGNEEKWEQADRNRVEYFYKALKEE
jgi:hypothetical protein